MNNKRIEELIQSHSHGFTSTESKIAQFVLIDPSRLSQLTTITNFADKSGFSTGSIMRFCKKLGFDGYSEFKFFLVNNLIQIEVDNKDYYLESLIDLYIQEISLLKTQLDNHSISKLAQAIKSATTTVIVAKNSSFVAAEQLKLRLLRTGIPAIAINDELTAYTYVDLLSKTDVVILFSVMGFSSKEYVNIVSEYQKQNIPVYLITLDSDTSLFEVTKEKILLPSSLNAKQHLALDGQISFMMFIEILLHKMVMSQND